ncbi:MAG TPA: hypothetical protein PLN81_05290 [Bacillota bacterium]|nr:hypothetical protein [Bacillota bacterium]HPT60995.1 hypothetical protein [Bacillota bacterium]
MIHWIPTTPWESKAATATLESDLSSLAALMTALEQSLDLHQRLALPAVEWLIGDRHPASGRTHLLAVAYVRLGILNLGRKIYVRDHYRATHDLQADQHLLQYVRNLIPSYVNAAFGKDWFVIKSIDRNKQSNAERR